MVSTLLAAEFDRKKTLEAKGATLVASSASVSALVFGLLVIVMGKDRLFSGHCARAALIAALVAFVISASVAIAVQTYGFKYMVIDREYLGKLTDDDEEWGLTADDAARNWVHWQVQTITTLRKNNGIKARLVGFSLVTQGIAIMFLSASAAFELYGPR
ncbi:hypothetical protein [Mycobacterium sp. NPDC050853]|uniref:hypothetical protein n=1 Tax=Mycobacterium sp. NPDC050853 TaxID=3155160 RepID=UPI0033F705D4